MAHKYLPHKPEAGALFLAQYALYRPPGRHNGIDSVVPYGTCGTPI